MARKKKTQARVWQRMLSGRRLDLIDPSALDIEVEDIAHGLARVARWNGQTRGAHAYSVAQHSLAVMRILYHFYPEASDTDARYALLHDAPEYVIGDMIAPFKAALGEHYKTIEKRLQAAIHLRYGLKAEMPATLAKQIKQADRLAAFYEATRFAGFMPAESADLFGKPLALPQNLIEELFTPWPTEKAQNLFLLAFNETEKSARKTRFI
jgi:5'-deoxynucleotidase YfbR-like HD superfamily hydrolase